MNPPFEDFHAALATTKKPTAATSSRPSTTKRGPVSGPSDRATVGGSYSGFALALTLPTSFRAPVRVRPLWWSCRESNPLQKADLHISTSTTRKHAKRRTATCGYASVVDGINTSCVTCSGHRSLRPPSQSYRTTGLTRRTMPLRRFPPLAGGAESMSNVEHYALGLRTGVRQGGRYAARPAGPRPRDRGRYKLSGARRHDRDRREPSRSTGCGRETLLASAPFVAFCRASSRPEVSRRIFDDGLLSGR
jgi:hypothetical protein